MPLKQNTRKRKGKGIFDPLLKSEIYTCSVLYNFYCIMYKLLQHYDLKKRVYLKRRVSFDLLMG